MVAKGPAQNTSKGRGRFCLWVYRRDGRGDATKSLGCEAGAASGIVAVFAVEGAAECGGGGGVPQSTLGKGGGPGGPHQTQSEAGEAAHALIQGPFPQGRPSPLCQPSRKPSVPISFAEPQPSPTLMCMSCSMAPSSRHS